jgi:hypothetical protein
MLRQLSVLTDQGNNILKGETLYWGGQIPMFQGNMLPASSGRIFTITAKKTPRLKIYFTLLIYFDWQ